AREWERRLVQDHRKTDMLAAASHALNPEATPCQQVSYGLLCEEEPMGRIAEDSPATAGQAPQPAVVVTGAHDQKAAGSQHLPDAVDRQVGAIQVLDGVPQSHDIEGRKPGWR